MHFDMGLPKIKQIAGAHCTVVLQTIYLSISLEKSFTPIKKSDWPKVIVFGFVVV